MACQRSSPHCCRARSWPPLRTSACAAAPRRERRGRRSDDMLKVSGIYVSPIEVESALITHPAVLEAAVIGKKDEEELVKPIAYVVLKGTHRASADLADELRHHVKSRLAPYKYPRW